MDRRLVLGLVTGCTIPVDRQIGMIKDAGFDKVFFSYHRNEKLSQRLSAVKHHAIPIGSLHAPFIRVDRMWHPTEETDDVIVEQIESIRTCHENMIPVSVHHVFIGFDRHEPTEAGLHNFDKIVREAERLGVKIAFENTEGIEYFDALMERYKNCSAVGFCIDSGHELCYNPGRDMIGDYGNKLACTHINDNLGVCGNDITYLDDLHLLPFDGKVDFTRLAKRLGKAGYEGDLTFELSILSKPDRHENDVYADMPFEEYLKEAYCRAVRVRELCAKYHKQK